MSKILKRTKAGRLVSAVLYTAPASGDPPKARAQKQKTSTWAREKLNARTSFQKLERKLAANFDNGDLFVTLTYDDKHLPKDRSQAVQRLTFDQYHTYEALASYLTAEPREWGHPKIGEHTWTPSRGLVSPEPETERVADDLMLGVPPGALVLDREGPQLNGWGEFSWVKYHATVSAALHAAQKETGQTEKTEKRIAFSILFCLGGKYKLCSYPRNGVDEVAKYAKLW